jgi:hypothetical protein
MFDVGGIGTKYILFVGVFNNFFLSVLAVWQPHKAAHSKPAFKQEQRFVLQPVLHSQSMHSISELGAEGRRVDHTISN